MPELPPGYGFQGEGLALHSRIRRGVFVFLAFTRDPYADSAFTPAGNEKKIADRLSD